MDIRNKIEGVRQILHFDNRFQLLAERILRPSAQRSVYKLGKIEFVVDRSEGDVNGLREILTTGMYLDHLPIRSLDRPITLLDIGANVGGFPLAVINAGHEIEHYVGIELNPKTLQRLKVNIRRNDVGRPDLVNAAVCGVERSIEFHAGKHGSVADSIYTSSADGDPAEIAINGVTLDSVFEKYLDGETVDICKMDIEGAEFEIFASNSAESLRRCRYLFIEIHHQADRPRGKVLSALDDLGFAEISAEGKDDEHHHVHFFVNELLSAQSPPNP